MSSILADQQRPLIRIQMPGDGGGCGVSANENSCVHQVTWSLNKLGRSNSIFNLWGTVWTKDSSVQRLTGSIFFIRQGPLFQCIQSHTRGTPALTGYGDSYHAWALAHLRINNHNSRGIRDTLGPLYVVLENYGFSFLFS